MILQARGVLKVNPRGDDETSDRASRAAVDHRVARGVHRRVHSGDEDLRFSGYAITGVRNHFLRFKIPESYHVVHDTGLVYDSTLGFAEHEGFEGSS